MEISFVASGLDHPECVAWAPSGWLAAAVRLARSTGSTSGPAPGRRSPTPAASSWASRSTAPRTCTPVTWRGTRILRIDREDGEITDLTTGRSEYQVATPNFPVFHPDGRLFFSDSGSWGARDGRLFCLDPDGAVRLVSQEAAAFPNGLAIDPGAEWLYIAESEVPAISRLRPNGGRSRRPPGRGRDAPDRARRAGLRRRRSAADRLLPAGCRDDLGWRDPDVLIEDWTGEFLAAPTNLAFIGEDLVRLVTANLGGYHVAELTGLPEDLRGAPLRYPVL